MCSSWLVDAVIQPEESWAVTQFQIMMGTSNVEIIYHMSLEALKWNLEEKAFQASSMCSNAP